MSFGYLSLRSLSGIMRHPLCPYLGPSSPGRILKTYQGKELSVQEALGLLTQAWRCVYVCVCVCVHACMCVRTHLHVHFKTTV